MENKYTRLLQNTTEDLREAAYLIVATEGTPSLEQLQSLISSIEQLKVARLSFQVWEEAKTPQ